MIIRDAIKQIYNILLLNNGTVVGIKKVGECIGVELEYQSTSTDVGEDAMYRYSYKPGRIAKYPTRKIVRLR